jgi:hypothetical protein
MSPEEPTEVGNFRGGDELLSGAKETFFAVFSASGAFSMSVTFRSSFLLLVRQQKMRQNKSEIVDSASAIVDTIFEMREEGSALFASGTFVEGEVDRLTGVAIKNKPLFLVIFY